MLRLDRLTHSKYDDSWSVHGGPQCRVSSPVAGPLDLDHLGAEVGERHRGQRAGEHPAEVGDQDPVEGGALIRSDPVDRGAGSPHGLAVAQRRRAARRRGRSGRRPGRVNRSSAAAPTEVADGHGRRRPRAAVLLGPGEGDPGRPVVDASPVRPARLSASTSAGTSGSSRRRR